LYRERQYFDLRDALRSNPGDLSSQLLFYKGAIANKFNHLRLSITYLNQYGRWAKKSHNNEFLIDCYDLLADDYLKTYRYRKAATMYRRILSRFRNRLTAEQFSDYENSMNKSVALSATPLQSVSFAGDSKLNSAKDRIGLAKVPIEINGQNISLPFDTGAALSVLTYSEAQKLRLRLINFAIKVESFTGAEVSARLGIASNMKIGNVRLHNVVFLVFEDRDLYLPPISFQINGLIGFPVITALREITFLRDGEILIPGHTHRHGEQNMCFDGSTPLLAGTFEGKRLIFSLDTGANKSDLFPPFYQAYVKEITSSYVSQSERIRGAGGYKDVHHVSH